MADQDYPPFAPDGELQWYTVREVAEAGNVSARRVRQLLKSGQLWGVKRAGVWLVWNVSVWKWLQSERRTGRPPKRERVDQLELDLDNAGD